MPLFTKIKNSFTHFCLDWWNFVSVPYNFANVIISLLVLYGAYEVTVIAAIFATKKASIIPVTDIFLTNFPRIDTSFIHGQVSFFLFDLRWVLFLTLIRYTPFAAKALALLVLLRAITINLTSLGIPDGMVPTIAQATFGGDLFFSGHVANLFMLGLCFWPIKPIRYFCILMSIIFGVSAILGHYHYTIDVIAAPFFAYGIFVLAKKMFAQDYQNSTVNSH